MLQDSLPFRPVTSSIPTVDATIEHTGSIENFPVIAEEGDTTNTNANDDNDDVPDLLHPDDDSSVSTSGSDIDEIIDDEDILDIEAGNNIIDDETSPQPIIELRRSTRTRKPNPKYAYYTRHYDWVDNADPSNMELATACASEAIPSLPSSGDALSWEPAPKSIQEILKMPEGTVRQAWLKSVWKELKALVDAKTFAKRKEEPSDPDNPQPGEASTPVMEIFKVKIKSDGSLDKLKTRMVVRGDLQDKNITEDKWSPTASFRSLKMFLAHAAKLKVRVRQLDFVGAFLQAKMRTRMFITIPNIYGVLFPEFCEFCGKPVRLQMSMYGTTLCGKYWYLDLWIF
jgi:hypothetical protein